MSRRKGVEIESVSNELIELRKKGVIVGASSVGVATVMALGLFLNVSDENYSLAASTSSPTLTGSNTLLASSSADSSNRYQKNVPPRITTKSSASALTLATDLKSLNSRMYGAFWCSHCYDQKQAFGYDAMRSIPYVECDSEGYNNERDVCKAREVQGYPTWEIGGKLFPGERSLDELREIVNDVMSGK
jgi:glutaredoxin